MIIANKRKICEVFVIYNSSTATEARATSNQKHISFRKSIKREETAYPT